MSAYFDTGVITKLYLAETDSPAAMRLAKRFPPPSVLTHLHRVELVSAWRMKLFRRELRDTDISIALENLDGDVRSGVWAPPDYDLDEVFEEAERLALRHASSLGTRTLDILHVANAKVLGTRDFVTGDERQAKLAAVVGMRVARLRG